VHGQSLNDVFVVGSFLEVVHYNGLSWHNYTNEISPADGALVGLDIKRNTVAIVGQRNQHALAIIGRR
jgi:hypothetical protein